MENKQKGILIICNLDTRGEDIAFVKDMIKERGHNPILLDFSMEEPPPFPGDITCEEVAERGGMPIEQVREYYRVNRGAATDNQINGAVAIVRELIADGKVDGAFGIGGGTSTLVSTSIMKELPFGVPKLMASPMAAHPKYIDQYVGNRDLVMHHTVLDIVKMNPLLKAQIINAVGAICGMVEVTQGTNIIFDKPTVAITSFGFGEMCVQSAVGFLEDDGFIPVPCHAQGKGDAAMEDMIRDGMFAGVIDVCIGGIVENLFGGNRDAGPDRLLAASEKGIPTVIAPCGLDFLSYGGNEAKLEATKTREQYTQDRLRIQVRTTAEELKQAAKIISQRLNSAKGPTKFIIPLQGWSSLDKEGRQLYDPEADAAFTKELKRLVDDHDQILEVDMHLYTTEFARKIVDQFIDLYQNR
ncbi:MAG: UPF0261 family protein [Proteobacteria bacterium]|nr:UPF0261 family protein [Pseudomonadota bacterium]